jgi:superfamily II DNA/RNA helicase
MFSVDDLRQSVEHDVLQQDLKAARLALSTSRLEEPVGLDQASITRLNFFIDSTLASAPTWNSEGLDLTRLAAEVAEVLASLSPPTPEGSRARIRAALLYELAGYPMMASAMVRDIDGPAMLIDFFKRRAAFSSLAAEIDVNGHVDRVTPRELMRLALCEDALDLVEYEHGSDATRTSHRVEMEELARHISFDLSLTEVKAFESVVERRAGTATRLRTSPELLASLRLIGFPPELWAAQAQALDDGLLNHDRDAWGFAAPTGTGKTFLARMLILDVLQQDSSRKILYIVPSKALVHQVSRDLHASLEAVGISVTAVTPQLVALDAEEDQTIQEASVLVLTPEKADLLLRIGADFLNEVTLVIVDEAHHIEDGTRGVLLELYLTRLKQAFAGQARYILLSAVAPNIAAIASWLGATPGSTLVRERSTRMKVGLYRIRREGRYNKGIIEYTDGTEIRVFEKGVKTGKRAGLVQLASRLESAGPLLVVAKGQGTAEKIAGDLSELLVQEGHTALSKDQLNSAEMQRLDSRLEREMYANVKLRSLIKWGVAYHHAGLPPRVREALEGAISAGHIRYVIATTTLAEGVNFPFSSVIVETLSIREPSFEVGKPTSYRIFTPRKFWNIAGRAGRPGYDHEGQVILFEPSLGLDRVAAVIDPYTEPDIAKIPPVTSALAEGLQKVREDIEEGVFELADLGVTELSEAVPSRAKGVVNLLRVGLAHARASGLDDAAKDYFEGTFASSQLPESDRAFARRILRQQQQVLDVFLETPDAPSIKLVAELGLSIDTLTRLQKYVKDLEDWQLESMSRTFYGGRINFQQLPYLLGPVLARMAELEGARLRGWYSELVMDWCQGKPFSALTPPRDQRLEQLIALMYSRIQFMLPWGLYATDRFVAEEAERRHIQYANEINKLAYLVDAGVPDWAALRLTSWGFERTDASRLSRAFFSTKDASETTDIMTWLSGQRDETLGRIVRGPDARSIDYDFFEIAHDLRDLR